MDQRHCKLDSFSEVLHKGGRCHSGARSGASSRRKSSSVAPSEKLNSESSSTSDHFHEVELTHTIKEKPSTKMKQNNRKNKYQRNHGTISTDKSEKESYSYDNKALELGEPGIFPEHTEIDKNSTEPVLTCNKIIKGNSPNCLSVGIQNPTLVATEITKESKKYEVLDRDFPEIRVREADCVFANAQNHFEEENNLELNRSLPAPPTLNTHGSLHHQSTSNDLRNTTPLLDFITNNNDIIQNNALKPLKFPPGISRNSFETYQVVQRNGVKCGRCTLMTLMVLTFCFAMVLTILILMMPHSATEKPAKPISTQPTPTASSMVPLAKKMLQLNISIQKIHIFRLNKNLTKGIRLNSL